MAPRTRCKHQKLPYCKPTTTAGMNTSWPYATVRLKESVSEEKEIRHILKHGFYPTMFIILEYY